MNLVKSTHIALKTVSHQVKEEEIKETIDLYHPMSVLMIHSQGVGLSANQIGITKRFFVWQYGMVINPIVLLFEGEIKEETEGCLSFPGVIKKVKRFNQIVVEYIDERGKKMRKTLNGLPARIFQHECDHLDGITILDK